MADLSQSLKATLRWEGGYANHPRDKGGETYRGIARNFHEEWRGWRLIDVLPKDQLDENDSLQTLVKEFYRSKFWRRIKGDRIEEQPIADAMFDAAVLFGPGRAIRFAQTVVDVEVDGVIGPITLGALNEEDPEVFIKRMAWERALYHAERVRDNAGQAVFLVGWLRRAQWFSE